MNDFFSSELAADGARQEKFCIDLMVGICFLVHVCVFELVLRNLLGKTESDNFCRNCFLVLCYLLAPFSDFFFSPDLFIFPSRLLLLGSYLLIEMASPTLMLIRKDWILRWTW